MNSHKRYHDSPSKTIAMFLTIFYILFTKFFNLRIFEDTPQEFFLVLIFGYLAFGIISLPKRRTRILYDKSALSPLWILIFSMICSMVMAYLYHGQSLFTSILAYKTQYLLFCIIPLLKIAPSYNTVALSLKYFSYIFILVVIAYYINPSLFPEKETANVNLGGMGLISYNIYFALQSLQRKLKPSTFVFIIYILFLLLAIQNRSTLFTCMLLIGCAILTMKFKYKILVVSVCALMACGIFVLAASLVIELYNETMEQVNDPTYARFVSMAYFLTEASPNVLCEIFGNGFISLKTSSLMEDLQQAHIYNSDVGFIGYWNQFGIMPIILFVYMILKSLLNKRFSLSIKLIAAQILICSVTVSYFGALEGMINFLVFYYLYEYNRTTVEALNFKSSRNVGNNNSRVQKHEADYRICT